MMKQICLVLLLSAMVAHCEIFDDCPPGTPMSVCAYDECIGVTQRCRTNMCDGCATECMHSDGKWVPCPEKPSSF